MLKKRQILDTNREKHYNNIVYDLTERRISFLIEVKSITKSIADKTVADNVSFKLTNGSFYGIFDTAQPNGGALPALLAGAILPDSGFVRINGFDTRTQRERSRACLGYRPISLEPYDELTPEEFLIFIAEAKGLEYEDGMRTVHELLDLHALRGRKRSLCRHLTKAEKCRLSLAQAFVGNPEILILEDPVSGLGEREKNEMLDRIEAATDQKTVFYASSDLPLLREICDKIIVLEKGVLIGIFEADDPSLVTYSSRKEEDAT